MAKASEYISGQRSWKNCFQSKSTSGFFVSCSVCPTSLFLPRCLTSHCTTKGPLSKHVPRPTPANAAIPWGRITFPICFKCCALNIRQVFISLWQRIRELLSLIRCSHDLLAEKTGTGFRRAPVKAFVKLKIRKKIYYAHISWSCPQAWSWLLQSRNQYIHK